MTLSSDWPPRPPTLQLPVREPENFDRVRTQYPFELRFNAPAAQLCFRGELLDEEALQVRILRVSLPLPARNGHEQFLLDHDAPAQRESGAV